VSAEQVFEKMQKAGITGESGHELIYFDVHDAVLAALECDATLCQQV